MKKIFIIAVLSSFVSCSSDDNLGSNDLNNKILIEQINTPYEYLVAQKVGDSLPADDTGGQGGHLPPPSNP
jgi:hypothetical protein